MIGGDIIILMCGLTYVWSQETSSDLHLPIGGRCERHDELVGIYSHFAECLVLPFDSLHKELIGFVDGQPVVCCPLGEGHVDHSILFPSQDNSTTTTITTSKPVPNSFRGSCGRNSRSSDSSPTLQTFPSSHSDWPWLVKISLSLNNGNLAWRCYGTLVSENRVLTSGWCLTGVPIHGLVLEFASGETTTAQKSKIHERYNPANGKNDFGILQIPRNEHTPVCLPSLNLRVGPSDIIHVFGWDERDLLVSASSNLLSESHCASAKNSASLQWKDNDAIICVALRNFPAYGYGSPLLVQMEGNWNIYGVESHLFGPSANWNGQSVVYFSKITNFVHWIQSS